MRSRILAILTVCASACSGAPTSPSGPARVTGRVVDYLTGAGVPGASVTFGQAVFSDAIHFTVSAPHAAVADASGSYAVSLPAAARYDVVIDGGLIGSAEITAPSYRGDLFARTGTCVARYGTLADAETRRPIANAAVSVAGGSAITGADGWYRIDLGCPENGQLGFGTTLIYFTHPAYADASQVVGRGVSGVVRLDFTLKRR